MIADFGAAKFHLATLLLSLICGSIAFGGQDDARFTAWMQTSRGVFEKNHLIAYVSVESTKTKGRAAECRYDRYPELERVQGPNGATYACKKGGSWLESDDWGETGKPVTAGRVSQLNQWRELVDAPLIDRGEVATRFVSQSKTKEGNEEFVFETGRVKEKGSQYPTYTFLKYPNSAENDAVLYKFSGPIDLDKEPSRLNIRYGYMVAVKMEVVTPTPSAGDAPAASSAAALPAPLGTSFTFAQVEQQKFNLKDRVVRVEIEKVLGEGQDIGNNMRRYIVKDTSKSATPYGQIEFPREGLEKTGLLKEGSKPVTLFVQVHVISTKAAAICRALGTKSSPVGEKQASYEW